MRATTKVASTLMFAQYHGLEMKARSLFYRNGFEVYDFKELTDDLLHILIGVVGEETFWFMLVFGRGPFAFLTAVHTQIEETVGFQ